MPTHSATTNQCSNREETTHSDVTTHSDGAPLRLRKVVPGTSFQPSTNSYTQRTKGTQSKRRTSSFRRAHKIFKQTSNSSEQALYLTETIFKPDSLTPFQTFFFTTSACHNNFLPPHPSPALSQPAHGERKAFLAVTPGLFGSGNPATRPHAFPGTTDPGQRGTSRPPSQVSQSPRKRKTFSPDQFLPNNTQRQAKKRTKKSLHFRTTIRRRYPNMGILGNLISTCLPSQETDYRLIRLHLLLPKGANQSAHTP